MGRYRAAKFVWEVHDTAISAACSAEAVALAWAGQATSIAFISFATVRYAGNAHNISLSSPFEYTSHICHESTGNA